MSVQLYVKHGKSFRRASPKQIRSGWIALQRKKVRNPGKTRRFSDDEERSLCEAYIASEASAEKFAAAYGISRATLYRILRRAKDKP